MGNQTLEKVLYDSLLEMQQSLSSSGINVQLGMKRNRRFRREALKLVPILGGQLFVRVFPRTALSAFIGIFTVSCTPVLSLIRSSTITFPSHFITFSLCCGCLRFFVLFILFSVRREVPRLGGWFLCIRAVRSGWSTELLLQAAAVSYWGELLNRVTDGPDGSMP